MPSIKLTKTAIKDAELPQSGSVDYQFENVPGLTLRVTTRGARTFYVLKRMRGGKLIREKIGPFPEVTPEQAQTRAQELIAALAMGTDPTAARREVRKAETVETAFAEFVKKKRKKDGSSLSERTKTEYEQALKLYGAKLLNKKLPAVTSDEIEAIYRKLGIKTPTAANRFRAMLSSFFEWCCYHRLVDQNPVKRVRRAFADTERERFLSGDELKRLFGSMDKINPDMRDFFMLSLLTGARRSNVQSMLWADVDTNGGEWRIARTKNGTSQTVPLSPEAVAILEQRKQAKDESPFVFPGRGKTGHMVEPKKAWKALLDEAQLSDLRLHDLRRTLGSWQAKTGASMAIIGKSLNHKSLQATRIYARLDLDPVRQSMQTATSAMMEAAGVKQKAEVVQMKKGARKKGARNA